MADDALDPWVLRERITLAVDALRAKADPLDVADDLHAAPHEHHWQVFSGGYECKCGEQRDYRMRPWERSLSEPSPVPPEKPQYGYIDSQGEGWPKKPRRMQANPKAPHGSPHRHEHEQSLMCRGSWGCVPVEESES
jgi:hypothetical protein